jgi:transposase InsO family protein
MCRVLAVSPAGFYASLRRPPSARTTSDAQLRLHVRAAHRASGGTYGAPRVAKALQTEGVACGRHRAARLLRAEGLRGTTRRRYRVTTDSHHPDPVAPNLVARTFAPAVIGGADRVWAADVTYLATGEGFLYLAAVLDVGTRRVIGWAMDRTLHRALPLAALQMACATRRPAPGALHHSDRGRQYASAEYRAALRTAGLTCSMSRAGDCWDNAVVESFFATLKAELGDYWPTRAAARHAVFAWIEGWYNRRRLHSSLGYRSPLQYEAALLEGANAA